MSVNAVQKSHETKNKSNDDFVSFISIFIILDTQSNPRNNEPTNL